MANRTDAPCYECPDRCVTEDHNCHMVCGKYLEFQESRRAALEANAVNVRLNEHKKDFSQRYIRYMHRRRQHMK